MTALQRALESGAPRVQAARAAFYGPADFPVPTGRQEEWRFTPLRSSAKGDLIRPAAVWLRAGRLEPTASLFLVAGPGEVRRRCPQ
jgi:hypothetical protein